MKLCKGKLCICCGSNPASVIPAHYSGMWSNKLGKGYGIKPHDLTADLCGECHHKFDNHINGNNLENSFLFCTYIISSLMRRVEDGQVDFPEMEDELELLISMINIYAEYFNDGKLVVT